MARASALRRWARLLLCLLLVYGALVQTGHTAPAQDYAGTIERADFGGGYPCDGDHGSTAQHCHAASAACPFCAPIGVTVTATGPLSTSFIVAADQITDSGVTLPLFRPPKLPLQV